MPIHVETTSPLEYPGDVPGRLLDGERYATLGDVTFGAVNDLGVRIHLARMDGWYDGPPSTGEVEQRESDDGGRPSPAYLTPRVVQILARLRGSSWPHLNATIDAIIGSVSLRIPEPLTVTDHGVTRVVWARQEGQPIVNRHGAGAEVSISLVAPDPRKYSVDVVSTSTGLPRTTGGVTLPRALPYTIDATVSSGVLVANNAGNMFTRPTLKLHGPTPPDTRITHRAFGKRLRIPEAVPAGRFLLLDVDKKRALLDGSIPRRVTGSWFDYAKGDNEIALSAPTYDPAALLTSEHRHAWR